MKARTTIAKPGVMVHTNRELLNTCLVLVRFTLGSILFIGGAGKGLPVLELIFLPFIEVA